MSDLEQFRCSNCWRFGIATSEHPNQRRWLEMIDRMATGWRPDGEEARKHFRITSDQLLTAALVVRGAASTNRIEGH